MPQYPTLSQIFGMLQGVPEDRRIGVMADMLGVTEEDAARVMATSAFAQNEAHAQGPPNFRTNFSPTMEGQFEQWLTKNLPGQADWILGNPFPDYDMRGFYQAMMEKGLLPKIGQRGPVFPNTFNTPYSLDFGPESIYWKKQQ